MALVANITLVLLSMLMGIRILRLYAVRRRAHSLWYGVGLILTAIAATPEVVRELTNALPTPLWWLYWSAASATVGFLAAGTAYLLSPRIGQVTLIAVCILSVGVVLATVLTAGPSPAELTDAVFAKAPTGWIKAPFLIQNIAGSLVILTGAAVSFLRTRAWYNVWIVLGTLLFAAGGTSAGLLKYSSLFYFTQTAGILVLYLGVTESAKPRVSQTQARAL